jgi:undecaprenyl-diphosphatase
LIGGEILNQLLKLLIHRARPEMILIHARGYSFPSGHAMLSVIAYGLFTYLLCLQNRSWKKRVVLVCGCAILALLIGLSRIYLGVHYFSDVVAGFAAGGLWLSTCITAIELVRKKRIKGSEKLMKPLT